MSMPGSAPAGGARRAVAAVSGTDPVAPVAPASPGSALANAGKDTAKTETTIAKMVAGAVDRRRIVAVAILPPCAGPRRLPDGSANVDPTPRTDARQRRWRQNQAAPGGLPPGTTRSLSKATPRRGRMSGSRVRWEPGHHALCP